MGNVRAAKYYSRGSWTVDFSNRRAILPAEASDQLKGTDEDSLNGEQLSLGHKEEPPDRK